MSRKNNNSRRSFIQNSVKAAAALTVVSVNGGAINEIDREEKVMSVKQPAETVLFVFDDHNIPWQHNLKITLVEAQKHPGNPVLRKGAKGSPDEAHAILYGTVIKTENKFRMWYLAMFKPGNQQPPAAQNWRPMCYAESEDGINWIKPELGLVEFNGNSRNNICLIEGNPHSLTLVNDFLSVLYEPDDPDPQRRYKAAYIAHVPYEDIAGGLSNIGMKEKTPCVTIIATSADGLSWKVTGNQPADAGGERFEVSGIYRFGNFYYLTGQLLSPWSWLPDGQDAGRVMMVYRSPDFINWSKAKAFGFARAGQLANPPVKGQQSHMGAGLWNRGNVLIGLYGMWQDGLPAAERPVGASHLLGTTVELGLLITNDGIHYREPVPGFTVISRGKKGEWDDVALLQGHAFVNEGDRTLIWYSHWDTAGTLKSMEIGLAALRRDGFGFLSCKENDNDAHFVTTLLEAGKRTSLVINAEGITGSSPLIIELLDHLDRPLKSYSETDAARLTADGTQVRVVWPGKTYLPADRKFAVKVKFPVNSKAKVYALYLVAGL